MWNNTYHKIHAKHPPPRTLGGCVSNVGVKNPQISDEFYGNTDGQNPKTSKKALLEERKVVQFKREG